MVTHEPDGPAHPAVAGSRAADRPTDHRGRYVPDGSWPPGRGRAGAAGAGAALRQHGQPGVRRRPLRDAGVAGGVAGARGLRPAEGHRARSHPGRAAARRGAGAGHRQPRGRRGRARTRPRPTACSTAWPGISRSSCASRREPVLRARRRRRRRGAVEPGGHPPRRHGGRHVVPVEGVPEQPLPLGLLRPLPQQLGSVVLGAGLREPHEGAGVPRPPSGPGRDAAADAPPRPRTSDEARPRGRRRRRAR